MICCPDLLEDISHLHSLSRLKLYTQPNMMSFLIMFHHYSVQYVGPSLLSGNTVQVRGRGKKCGDDDS